MIDPIAPGREATHEGKHYRVISVDPPGRTIVLERLPHGETDPPAILPVFDLREAASIYIPDTNRVLACVVTDDIREISGKKFISVAFIPHGVVGQRYE